MSRSPANAIVLDGVTKVYSGDVTAVRELHLAIEPGEFMVLVGPSGCGKSTIMRMVCGLEGVTSGSIYIGGDDVTRLAPRDRDVAMVFQSYALYPHMTVRKNIGYGLRVRRTPKAEVRRRVEDVARMLGIDALLERHPAQLSGGERQRVAMGRAIVREPKAFLMDEPLSNLDAKLRVLMRAELARLHRQLGITTIFVTHDQVEAMTLGHRVAVMDRGELHQVDTPSELYRSPANVFVAGFIGSPPMNLVDAIVSDGRVDFAGFSCPIDPTRRPSKDGPVVLGIRPHDIQDASSVDAGKPQISIMPIGFEQLGSEVNVIFPLAASGYASVLSQTDGVLAEHPSVQSHDSTAELTLATEVLFTARVDASTDAQPGHTHHLALDPEKFYYFDPENGASLTMSRPTVSAR